MAMLAFSGSRKLSPVLCRSSKFVLAAAAASGRWSSLGVGCCPSGLDAAVRSAPQFQGHRHRVFNAQSRSAFHLVSRSVQMCEIVCQSSGGGPGGLVAYPGCPCPEGLLPNRNAVKCFSGFGSGTWATAALCAGRGARVWVAGLTASQLPASWGSWRRSARFPGCWRLVGAPVTHQLPLFS